MERWMEGRKEGREERKEVRNGGRKYKAKTTSLRRNSRLSYEIKDFRRIQLSKFELKDLI